MVNPGHLARWATTAQACRELGIGRSTLQKLKAAGIFPAGRCFYVRGLGRSGPCMWDIETCRQILQRLSAADPSAIETYAMQAED